MKFLWTIKGHKEKKLFSQTFLGTFYPQKPVQKLPNLFPSSDPGPIGFFTCGRMVAHGVARVGTTSDYDRHDYV